MTGSTVALVANIANELIADPKNPDLERAIRTGVAGLVAANIFVGRIFRRATGVAAGRRDHASGVAK